MKINAAIHGILLALKKTSSRITPIDYIPSDNNFTIHILVA
jgi:hypothetical protein